MDHRVAGRPRDDENPFGALDERTALVTGSIVLCVLIYAVAFVLCHYSPIVVALLEWDDPILMWWVEWFNYFKDWIEWIIFVEVARRILP